MRCGVGNYTARLAEATVTHSKHQVTVVTSDLASIKKSSKVRILPIIRDWEWKEFFVHYCRFLAELPRLVVVQYPSVMPGKRSELVYWLPLLLRVFLPFARVMFIIHEFAHTHPRARKELKKSLRFAHEVVLVNHADELSILVENPRIAQKLRFVQIGSTIEAYTPSPKELKALRNTIVAEEKKILFFFGFLNPEKGFEQLLEALRSLDERFILVVSGGLEPSNQYHAKLARLIKTLKLTDRIIWLGFPHQREVAKWLNAADAVVLPFTTGAMENKTSLLAALINRAVVLTTERDDTPPYLKNGENVMLVPPSDPQALTQAIKTVTGSKALMAKLRVGAASLAPRFEWSSIVLQLFGGHK